MDKEQRKREQGESEFRKRDAREVADQIARSLQKYPEVRKQLIEMVESLEKSPAKIKKEEIGAK